LRAFHTTVYNMEVEKKYQKTAAFGEIDGTFNPFHFIFVTTQHYRLPENNLSTGV